jgi:hypothetical protein
MKIRRDSHLDLGGFGIKKPLRDLRLLHSKSSPDQQKEMLLNKSFCALSADHTLGMISITVLLFMRWTVCAVGLHACTVHWLFGTFLSPELSKI